VAAKLKILGDDHELNIFQEKFVSPATTRREVRKPEYTDLERILGSKATKDRQLIKQQLINLPVVKVSFSGQMA